MPLGQRLYTVRVEIFEAATNYAYPIVTHLFSGRSPQEAWNYHEAHRQADAFLKQCEDQGLFRSQVRCKARITEGWNRP